MIDLWIDDKGLVKINADSEEREFFRTGFGIRDRKHGCPGHPREEKGVMTSSLWNIAEAFFTHYSSTEFADMLASHARDPEGDASARALEFIKRFEDFVFPGFLFGTSRSVEAFGKPVMQRWKFSQIYVPGYSNERLDEIIPKRFQSRSVAQDLRDWRAPHTTPLIPHSSTEEAIGRLKGVGREGVAFETVANKCMNRRKELIGPYSRMQVQLYQKWDHPVLIHGDSPRNTFQTTSWTNEEALLDYLCYAFPRFNNSRYGLSGKPKDMNPNYLASG